MKQPEEQYKPAEKLELKKINELFPRVFKKVCCPSCDQVISSSNLNLQNKVAKCGSCDVIFSIDDEVESVKKIKEMKHEVFRPEGIDLFSYQNDLDITIHKPPVEPVYVWSLFTSTLALGFTTLLYFKEKLTIPPFIPIAFGIITLYLLYKILTYTKSKTFININDKMLSIKTRPNNLKKDKSYAASDIDQLYIISDPNGTGHYIIQMVMNSLEGQKHQKLLSVQTLSKAKYLEQEIERFLNIENRKVPEATA